MKIYITFIASEKDVDFEVKPVEGSPEGQVIALKGEFDASKDNKGEIVRVFNELKSMLEDQVNSGKVDTKEK